MTEPVYTVAHDMKGKWYPNGPGDGFGYYSGMLHPHTRFDTQEEVENLCVFLNLAYEIGVINQREKFLEALGIGDLIPKIGQHDFAMDGLCKVAYNEGKEKYMRNIINMLELKI